MIRRVLFFILLAGILIAFGASAAVAADHSLEKDLLRDLAQTRPIIAMIKAGRQTKGDMERLKGLAENIKAAHLLLDERFKQREQERGLQGPKAKERHLRMRQNYWQVMEEYVTLLEGVAQGRDLKTATLDRLMVLINKLLPKRKRPLYGSLPYRHLRYAAKAPRLTPVITPAYQGGDRVVVAADTAATPEAPISEEIAALANALGWSPVAIYEWVKNNIETEWYWGCMKGAEETLRQKSGNACDQAALLVALLRAAGYPCRYVRGTIEFFPDIEVAKNLTGIADERELAAFFQKAGIPYKQVVAGGRIANLQIEHVWVESYIPYANYRGVVIDDQGKTWLALDTAIKAAGYTYNEPQQIPSEVSLPGIREDYLAAVQTELPLEYLRAQIEAVLPAGSTYEDLLATRQLIPEEMKILPASLQFKEIAITGEYAAMPQDLMLQARFRALAPDKAELFAVTLPAFTLTSKPIVFTYEPETVEDQEIINSYGGLGNTPSYLIRLRPVLQVDGERMAIGIDGFPSGTEYTLSLDLISPSGTEKITNTLIIGNLAVMGFVAQQTIVPEDIPLEEKDAQRLLFEEAMHYIDRWNQAEAELASLLNLTLARPVPTVVTLGGVVEVTSLLDIPQGFEWKGVYVDADLRAIEAGDRSQQTGDRIKTFMQLSGLQGSILEDRIFEDDFQVESVSTAKLFGLAKVAGVAIVTIDKTNISTLLPTLAVGDDIKEAIQNAVNQNLTIHIPNSEISYEDWTGIGFLAENPATGEAGWMLTGEIAGGMTVWNPERWPVEVRDILENPYTTPPNKDPLSGYSIEKITGTDRKWGVVGQPLGNRLQVIVRDKGGKPVEDAQVTFTVKAGGGSIKGDGKESNTELKVRTNDKGIAEVQLILGKLTGKGCTEGDCTGCPTGLPPGNPAMIMKEGDTYAGQIGENIVDAALTASGTALIRPFVAYAEPAAPNYLRMLHGNGVQGPILTWVGFVSTAVEDQYCNPISNFPTTFSVQAPTDNSQCPNPNKDTRNAVLVKLDDPCIEQNPVYDENLFNQCKSASSSITVPTKSDGAAVQVILGAIPEASYPIQATAGNLNTTFTLRTYPFGNCDGGSFPTNALKITTMYPTDLYGNNVNAAKKGTPIPVMARIYFLREKEEVKENVSIPCNSNTVECDIIIGKREYYIDTALKTPSSISFNEMGGDDPDGDGIYTASYPLSDEAKGQKITIKGTGTVTIQKSYPLLLCDNCELVNDNITASASQTMQVYAVDITVPQKLLALVDESGYTVADLPITYTILPDKDDLNNGFKKYQAITAKVVITKKGETEPLAYMSGNTQGTDTVTLATGFKFNIAAAYEAQVILNEGTGVEIRSNPITLSFARIYIEKQDPQFLDSKLRWNDFYPALGDGKTIVIRGEDTSGNPLNTKKIKAQIEYPAIDKVKVEPVGGIKFDQGRVAFKLIALDKEGVAPSTATIPTGIDFVKVRFDILSDDDIKEGEFFGFWNVRNNSNTTLAEVLAGEGVFVYDESTAINHIGKTEATVTEDGKRKFDFVQELLNQVVPRKRSVTDYTLLSEDGIFSEKPENNTVNAIKLFKDHFKVDNSAINDGKNTFNKVKKDYGLTEKNKIIDKETLVGVIKSDDDVLINASTAGDTGLYELYENVVKRFLKEMIDEAKRFAGQAVQPGNSVPTQNWVARTGQSAAQHGPGMSYCYGCKNTISEFNNATNGVANCKAEDTDMIKNRETDTIEGNEYRGNIGDTCTIGGGSKRWAGLYSSISGKKEYNLYNRCIIQSNPDPPCTDTENLQARPFKPNYWAGIDCSGLVYRSMASGKIILGAAVTMTNVHIYDFMNIHAADWFGVNQTFENERVFNFDKTLADKIHKGDLVQYDDHVSMVYSDKASYVGNDTRYQIIHAYGTPEYTYPDYDPTSSKQRVFSRKVLITWQDISASPTGFARIKLW